ncbi:ATP-dependent DNA helicase RecG [Anaerovorax odorimutans]|uniref:ATP-dependent DNA helicase RecG n=1 Tax=Anaerovorax odorimutans TaxID=109327 RepID=UPI0004230F19|nr:ATP-dependent DNA helicase RecG [Anaerovorax odorimutans]
MGINDEIKTIKGIGTKKAIALEKLGIKTKEDLINYYPRDYEDRSNIKNINNINNGETALLKGKVTSISKTNNRNKRKKQILKLLIEDNTGSIEIVFFNANYLEKVLLKNYEYEFFGKVNILNGKKSMLHPDISKIKEEENLNILPVYALTKGITQKDLRKWQKIVISELNDLEEYLPYSIIERNRLCDIKYAIKNIHFPENKQKLKESKYRLIFDELFLLQLGLLSIRNKNKIDGKGICFSKKVEMQSFTNNLSYNLTKAQTRVIEEINKDMESQKIMNRLVQGDVGSGKTVIAEAAIYKAVKSGYQAVMMAPTEILARQHYENLQKDFDEYNISVGFLASSIKIKEKKEILNDLEMGKIDLLIGTHAIIQPYVKFFNLGLVITDEQHRFGVNQRNLLSDKGKNPDIIVMTATPIPRTLAIILYGDLDISLIDEMPPGRKEIITKEINSKGRKAAYGFLNTEIKKGRQVYVVAPLIDESDSINARSAVSIYEDLKNIFKEYKINLLHGAMKQSEKDTVMEQFNAGEINILVSTVVIEVGINVPNATIMVIENSERFGLSQLHQLRGRVGRGSYQSYCILVNQSNSDIAKKRAQIMTSTNDGFIIAEKDLELRGPGEFFGIKQHGVPELKIADLAKHIKILNTTKKEVNLLLEKDKFLIDENNKKIKEKIIMTFKNIDNINI